MKSAYNLALKLKDRKENGGESSTAINEERRLWDIIWKANIPQKIRIFGWRAASDSLTVQVNRVLHHQATIALALSAGLRMRVLSTLLFLAQRLVHFVWR